MERLTQERFQQENKFIAGRIQRIAETIKEANPEADCYGKSLLFFSKEDALIRGIAFMGIYLEKPAEKRWLFDLPDDLDYPVYTLTLRPEDFGGDLVPADARILAPVRTRWEDRNGVICNYSYTYLFTEQGRGVLINHGYDEELEVEEYGLGPVEAIYSVDLDVYRRDFPSRGLDWGDYEKVGLVLRLIESGQFYPSPLHTWIKS